VSEDSRSTARDNHHLRYEDLFSCVDQLLSPKGSFSMVCPFEYRNKLCALGLEHNLHLVHELHLKGTITSPFKRTLMRFEQTQAPLQTEQLILEESRHQRTFEHQQLVQDFYL
jgi:tRNA1Val (adenine37-N6)-methyltransferase